MKWPQLWTIIKELPGKALNSLMGGSQGAGVINRTPPAEETAENRAASIDRLFDLLDREQKTTKK